MNNNNIDEILQELEQNNNPTSTTNNPQIYTISTSLGEQLKKERKNLHISQRKLSSLTRISQTTISRIERGWTQNIYAYIKIAHALNKELTIK